MSVYKFLGRVLYWVVWPVSWVYLRRSRRTRLLIICQDEILVVHNWLGMGTWSLPGGGLHANENPAEGVVRETFEETGIRLDVSKLWFLSEEWYRNHGFRYKCLYFTATLDTKPATQHQRFEIVELAWTKRSDVSLKTHGMDVIRALELLDTK